MSDYKELKEDFIALLRLIDRPGANIEGLIKKLEDTDFFTAPASVKYHNSFFGGLLRHSLNVYNNLSALVEMKGFGDIISRESIIICALLHDMSKINFYEKTCKNKKVYSEFGSKHDELGNFDWKSEYGWAVKPEKDRFIYGSHEETSEYMIRCYIPLKLEESVAILHHHAGMSNDSTVNNISGLYHRFPLANLLHVADMLATFLDETYDE